MPPLQKRALYGLIAAIVMLLVVISAIFLVNIGAGALLILAIASLALAYWVPRYLTRPRTDQPVIMDERDKAILSSVPRYQYAGILLTIGAWIVTLVAIYGDRGQVPIKFLWLMLYSVFGASLVFATAGVMMGYWRAKSQSQTEADPDHLLGAVVTGKWRFAILIVLVVVAVAVLVFTRRSESGPRADFTSDVTLAHVGDSIHFTDTSEREASSFLGDVTAWRWGFGDNTYGEEQNPIHAYSSPGQHTVELTVFYRSATIYAMKEAYITVLPSGSP